MIWITYAPLLSQASEYYNNSSDWVLQTVNFFIYGYMLPLIFVNMISHLIHKKKLFKGSWVSYRWLRYTLIICLITNALSAWVRYWAGKTFYIILIAQIVGGLAQNFFLACAPCLIINMTNY